MKNLYDILQVSENASDEIIEKSYKTLAKKYHPDIATNKVEAEERMKDINVAYDTLSDSDKRSEYDKKLHIIKTEQVVYQPVQHNHNAEYDGYHKNHENFNFFQKIMHLDKETKKLLIAAMFFVAAVSTTLYFYVHDFMETYYDTETAVIEEKVEISDDRPINISKDFISNILSDKNIEYKLFDDSIIIFNIFENDSYNKLINERILKDISVNIIDSKVYQNEAYIFIEVERMDISYSLGRYYMNFWTISEKEITDDDKYKMLVQAISENDDKIGRYKDQLEFKKINGEWTLQLKESNIYKLYGFSINKKI